MKLRLKQCFTFIFNHYSWPAGRAISILENSHFKNRVVSMAKSNSSFQSVLHQSNKRISLNKALNWSFRSNHLVVSSLFTQNPLFDYDASADLLILWSKQKTIQSRNSRTQRN